MKEKELPEEDQFEEEEHNEEDDLRFNALEMAIKTAGMSPAPRDHEWILKVAKDYYTFIIGENA